MMPVVTEALSPVEWNTRVVMSLLPAVIVKNFPFFGHRITPQQAFLE